VYFKWIRWEKLAQFKNFYKKLVVGVPRNKILTLSKNPFEFYLVTFFNLDCIDCNTTIFGTQYDYGKFIWLKYDLTFGTRKTTKYKKK